MACDITKGRKLTCKDAVGGLRKVYFINYDDMPETAYTYDADGSAISAVSGLPSAYEYDLHLGNDLTQTPNSSAENGTTYFEQVLNLTLKKLTQEDNAEIQMLAYGHPKIMVLDQNGNYMLVGAINGSDLSGGSAVTGNAMGDLNGYTLSFTGMEKTLANFYTGDFESEFTVVAGT